jgi:hypothetical protein
MRINDNDRKVSKLTDDCLFLIFEGKKELLLVFFGLIFLLLPEPVSGSSQWVRALVGGNYFSSSGKPKSFYLFRDP